MEKISERDKISLEIFQKHGGVTTVSEKLRINKNGMIQIGESPMIEISHNPTGLFFEIDEYPDIERNKLVGLRMLRDRLSKIKVLPGSVWAEI